MSSILFDFEAEHEEHLLIISECFLCFWLDMLETESQG